MILNSFFERDGCLTTLESATISDFTIERVFWIYNVPRQAIRADHACMNARIAFVAVNGSVTISTEDQGDKKSYILNNKSTALIVEPGIWVRAHDFSEGAVLMCFSDKKYEECVYINNHDEYLMNRNN